MSGEDSRAMSAPEQDLDLPLEPTMAHAWKGHLASTELYQSALSAYADEASEWLFNRLCDKDHRGFEGNRLHAGQALKYLILHMRPELLAIAETSAKMGQGPVKTAIGTMPDDASTA